MAASTRANPQPLIIQFSDFRSFKFYFDLCFYTLNKAPSKNDLFSLTHSVFTEAFSDPRMTSQLRRRLQFLFATNPSAQLIHLLSANNQETWTSENWENFWQNLAPAQPEVLAPGPVVEETINEPSESRSALSTTQLLAGLDAINKDAKDADERKDEGPKTVPSVPEQKLVAPLTKASGLVIPRLRLPGVQVPVLFEHKDEAKQSPKVQDAKRENPASDDPDDLKTDLNRLRFTLQNLCVHAKPVAKKKTPQKKPIAGKLLSFIGTKLADEEPPPSPELNFSREIYNDALDVINNLMGRQYGAYKNYTQFEELRDVITGHLVEAERLASSSLFDFTKNIRGTLEDCLDQVEAMVKRNPVFVKPSNRPR